MAVHDSLQGHRAAIVDEWALLRYGIESVLRTLRMTVVAQDPTLTRAGPKAEQRGATIVVVGRPADIDSVEAVRQLKAAAHPPKVAALLPVGEGHRLPTLLDVGADAVLPRDTDADELEHALRRLSLGARYVGGVAASAATRHMADRDAGDLTRREREILRCLAQRKSNQQIAEELYVSVATVKTHLRNLFEKLGVGSRHDAVAKAIETGALR